MNKGLIMVIIVIMLGNAIAYSYDDDDSSMYFQSGLLGAASGAVGGLASGSDSSDVWKGALAGMGVSLLGSALFKAGSNKKSDTVKTADSLPSEDVYSQGYQDGYQQGYNRSKQEAAVAAVKKD